MLPGLNITAKLCCIKFVTQKTMQAGNMDIAVPQKHYLIKDEHTFYSNKLNMYSFLFRLNMNHKLTGAVITDISHIASRWRIFFFKWRKGKFYFQFGNLFIHERARYLIFLRD